MLKTQTTEQISGHGMWSSKLAFILAATGAAVGLGNIWRFPYVTAENGGGAFVLIYLGCIALVGIPLLMTEILLGRAGRHSPINSLLQLARRSNASRTWSGVGVIGALVGVLVLSFYFVVAGWTLAYVWTYAVELVGSHAFQDTPQAHFDALLASPARLLFWSSLFLAVSVGVVAMGVEKGLEGSVRLLMPLLFGLLLIMVGYGMASGHFLQSVVYLFEPDFSAINGNVILQAVGQAFFSLSLGMTGIMAYGAYVPRDMHIGKTAAIIALADTSVAILAGLAIFPIVFAFGLESTGGPGLIFVTLPHAFAAMEFGNLYALAFFTLLAVAAWTSAISLLEPATAYLVERTSFNRPVSVLIIGGSTWLLGIGSVLSFNYWSEFLLWGKNFQELIEYVSTNIMLPAGGLLIAVFAGWIVSRVIVREQLADMNDDLYQVWRVLIRFVVPIAVLLVFLVAAGLI